VRKCVRLPGRVVVHWLGEASGGAETTAGVSRVAADCVLLTQIGGRGSALSIPYESKGREVKDGNS
jgi:hypothetical protein